MAAGAAVLAISAVFASKANKKFTLFSTADCGTVTAASLHYGSAIFTTKTGTGEVPVYALIYTVSGTNVSSGHSLALGKLEDPANGHQANVSTSIIP